MKVQNRPRLSLPRYFDTYEIPQANHEQIENRFEVLGQTREVAEPEHLWQETKEILLNTAETCMPKKRRQKNNWITDETIRTVSEKRKIKARLGMHSSEYKERQREVKHLCRRNKGKYIHELCIKLEEEQSRGNSKGLFQMVKK